MSAFVVKPSLSDLQPMVLTRCFPVLCRLVERCFNDCIMNFSTKSLDKKEISCLENCAEKFVKHSVRSAQKFQEASQEIQVPQAPGV